MQNRKLQYVILLGAALGFSLAASYLPGGYDAFAYYLKAPAANTTAPAWVYLVTLPISLLGWPLGWQFLIFISVLLAGVTALVWANKRWWIVLVTTPMLWNVWLGQIELFPVVGLLLTGLVLQKKIPVGWLGLSWLALLTKPQVGLGILVLQGYWLWRNPALRKAALTYGLGAFTAVVALTLVLWPGWIPNWVMTMRTFTPTWWNAAIWPYGLVAWPIILLASKKLDDRQQFRMFSAASLLGSPYFALYHCVTLLTLTDSLIAILLSWGIVLIGNGMPEKWMKWGWLLPAGLLANDLVVQFIAKRRSKPVVTDSVAAGPKL